MKLFFLFFFGIFFSFFDFLNVCIFSFFLLSVLFFYCLGFYFGGFFFIDGLSFFLIFLSFLIFFLCCYSSLTDFFNMNFFSFFLFLVGGISFFLLVCFSCFSVVVFYFCFEFIFILMFIFVLGWGYSVERLQASFYMVFYTLVVSFPFLIYLILGGFISLSFFIVQEWAGYWWVFLFFVFFVKLPVYGVHLWLPKAHVEAPVSGSMVLAGVLLKLGCYGFVRLSFFVGSFFSVYCGYFLSIGLLGSSISCFLCLRQVDLKSLVAYSSVCHMGMALAGFYSYVFCGLGGGVYMMIGHGFCSSCLFYIFFVFYERFYSRSLLVVKGGNFSFPFFGMVLFFFSVINMGVPPSLSFFSEVFILAGVGSYMFFCLFFFSLVLFFSGCYNIYLYVSSTHGFGFFDTFVFFITVREFILFFIHFFPLFFVPVFLGFYFY